MTEKSLDKRPEDRLWSMESGDSPVIATAIHDGHGVRDDVLEFMALSSDERLREEDPFTGAMIADFKNRIVAHRSRFETDLNRARSEAVYLTPEQSWGLQVWKTDPPAGLVERSLSLHDDYYAMLETTLERLERRYGKFIVLDLHSYNHRRDGAHAAPTGEDMAPEINIGTFSMDRHRWGNVVDALAAHFSSMPVCGRYLDVRENVAFQGKGEQTRFIHSRFPQTGCAIAIEFKKFFMDEWTGEPDMRSVNDLKLLMATAEPLLENLLREMP